METDDSGCASTSAALGKHPPDPNQAHLLHAGARAGHSPWVTPGAGAHRDIHPGPPQPLPGPALPTVPPCTQVGTLSSSSSGSASPAPHCCPLSRPSPAIPKGWVSLAWHTSSGQALQLLWALSPSQSCSVACSPLQRSPALLTSLLSAQCEGWNHEHRLSCTPGAHGLPVSAADSQPQPHTPQHPPSASCRTPGAHPALPGSPHQPPKLPALGWDPLGDGGMFPGDTGSIPGCEHPPAWTTATAGHRGNHCSIQQGELPLTLG